MWRVRRAIEQRKQGLARAAFGCVRAELGTGDDVADAVFRHDLAGGADVVVVAVTEPDAIDSDALLVTEEGSDDVAQGVGSG